MVTTSHIVDDAAAFVGTLYRNSQINGHFYHTLEHTVDTVAAARDLAAASGLSSEETEIAELAAWFHDAGHVEVFDGHEVRSAELARSFLGERGYPPDRIESVVRCIMATRYPQTPQTLVEAVVCDADMRHLGRKDYADRCDLLRHELESRLDRRFTDSQWLQTNIDFLAGHQYHTDAARVEFDRRRQKNIAKLQKRLHELLATSAPIVAASGSPVPPEFSSNGKRKGKKQKESDEKQVTAEEMNETPVVLTLAEKAKKAKTERGIETMFRTTSRNHLDLSAMADNKANIILGITTLITSIVVTLLLRKLDEAPYLLLPTLLLLAVTLASMVLATISTRPKITHGTFTPEDVREKRVNLLFFGNFHSVPLREYEWGMREMMNDSDYLYGSMIKDIYFLGKVLARKYRYLRYAYNVFMYGMVLSVAAFIVALMLAPEGALHPSEIFTP